MEDLYPSYLLIPWMIPYLALTLSLNAGGSRRRLVHLTGHHPQGKEAKVRESPRVVVKVDQRVKAKVREAEEDLLAVRVRDKVPNQDRTRVRRLRRTTWAYANVSSSLEATAETEQHVGSLTSEHQGRAPLPPQHQERRKGLRIHVYHGNRLVRVTCPAAHSFMRKGNAGDTQQRLQLKKVSPTPRACRCEKQRNTTEGKVREEPTRPLNLSPQ